MILPSIDIRAGRAVQLIGGETLALDAGDPLRQLEAFRLAGEVCVVDLDAAMGEGGNRATLEAMCRAGPCRVGGGIRDRETAVRWLDAGATAIVLGTAAREDWVCELPRERVIVALDGRDGEVVVDGWRRRTGRGVLESVAQLRGRCSGFLVTFVEREGRLAGTDMQLARAVVSAAGGRRVTIAGGVTSPEEVAALDALGADAQVGMALYTGRMSLADAFAAPLRSDRSDGLWPTVVCDEGGSALGLAWSDLESLRLAFERRAGVYHSRRRGLWIKGQSSGATQELLRVDLDCDRDALRFTLRQAGSGFCHLERAGCFGPDRGLARLARRLERRLLEAPRDSYSARLLADPDWLASKLREEAGELVLAESREEVRHEAADLLYFALVRMTAAGVGLAEVEAELDRRELRVTRRAGEAKDELS